MCAFLPPCVLAKMSAINACPSLSHPPHPHPHPPPSPSPPPAHPCCIERCREQAPVDEAAVAQIGIVAALGGHLEDAVNERLRVVLHLEEHLDDGRQDLQLDLVPCRAGGRRKQRVSGRHPWVCKQKKLCAWGLSTTPEEIRPTMGLPMCLLLSPPSLHPMSSFVRGLLIALTGACVI